MRFFGIFSSFEQWYILRVTRDDKLLNDNGNSFMAVPAKEGSCKDVILPTKSGNLLSLEQPERLRYLRDSNIISSGSLLRYLQPRRYNPLSRLRNPMDEWTLDKLVQYLSSSSSRFWTPVKSGVLIKFLE
jgi:hypothetical protein